MNISRRKLIWIIGISLTLVSGVLAFVLPSPLGLFLRWRRRLPQPFDQPGTKFRLGSASDFPVGVDTRFRDSYRVFVVRNTARLYLLYGRCPHRGCTPEWVSQSKKFVCPCHESQFCMGSMFDGNGINCQGPADRPLDRVHVERDAQGQIFADVGRLYPWSQNSADEPGSYVSVD